MALDHVVGYTDDGLVWMQFQGQQEVNGQPVKTTITIEPDHAALFAKNILKAADKARLLNKRPLMVGQPQTFKRG